MHSNGTALPPSAFPNGDNIHNRLVPPYGAHCYGGGGNGANLSSTGFGGRKNVVQYCKVDGTDLELSHKITMQLQQVALGQADASIDLDQGKGGLR